ncbi:MAG: hypothetical protein R3E01_01690 [Pirellulaceae bacterium]
MSSTLFLVVAEAAQRLTIWHGRAQAVICLNRTESQSRQREQSNLFHCSIVDDDLTVSGTCFG